MLERTWRPRGPVDVLATLSVHQRGPSDPAFQIDARGRVWRTCRPGGDPATVCIARAAGGEVTATAWGPGAAAALDAVPRWLGAEDDVAGFAPEHPVLAEAFHRFPGTVIGRTGLVMEALVAAILEQKVTGTEAYRGWMRLLRKFGEPAPGPTPARMRVIPPADLWAKIPSWDYHQAGVGPQRSRTIVTAGRHVAQLEATVGLGSAEADRRLRAIPGIGVWTSAEVRQRVFGDADAVSVGDYGLPHAVAYALTGSRRGSDELMLELLEPYRGHRHRACVLLLRAGATPPRRGPRAPVRDYRGM
ncbi:DNA-3-methyladenine glycosylase family protein [Jiangella mangrovi]|uniref:DNA-3-methyladenine glycosylase II n=1 Tax=Jiangella mangrovi TaxID=1524084 RepID=A0A7W9GRK9_9ACTN|nr:DNA-3-methyladenine glycosylase 2 family protein [Jiangella mangrovi]MBB5788461.1 3-methyladenine DNA glycosylase/8-oxoguanine DNA glycosylase [Jiangella mangrovi]